MPVSAQRGVPSSPCPWRWQAACRRRGGNPPRPGFPPEGETGKGEIQIPCCRRQNCSAGANYSISVPNSSFWRTRRFREHLQPLVIPAWLCLCRPASIRTLRGAGAKFASRSVPVVIRWTGAANSASTSSPSLSAGRRSAATAQSPGYRRRQSVAGLLSSSKSSLGAVIAIPPLLPTRRYLGRRRGLPLGPPRFIALPAHPQMVQQDRQLPRHRHHRPPLGFLFSLGLNL